MNDATTRRLEVMAVGGSAAQRLGEHPWRTEALDLIRATSGGLLFGVPLLYTMEVWWAGTRTPPWVLLALAALLFVPVFVMNKTEGFRATRDVRWRDAGADTVEAVALAVVVTAPAKARQRRPSRPRRDAYADVVLSFDPIGRILEPSRSSRGLYSVMYLREWNARGGSGSQRFHRCLSRRPISSP